jgi:hypothetical protein
MCGMCVAEKIASLIDAMVPTPVTRFFCWMMQDGLAGRHAFAGDISNLPQADPTGCGFAAAQVWQQEQDAVVTFPDNAPVRSHKMDFSTSSLADPGAPLVACFGSERVIITHRSNAD